MIASLIRKTKPYKELLEINNKLRSDFEELITNRATLTDLAQKNGTITVEAATESAALLATQFLHWLDELKAENYLETVFKESIRNAAKHDRKPIEVTVTVQRKEGKTPHQIRKELEEVLQEVAYNLGVGGYNSENLTPADFRNKIMEGLAFKNQDFINLLNEVREERDKYKAKCEKYENPESRKD